MADKITQCKAIGKNDYNRSQTKFLYLQKFPLPFCVLNLFG